VARGFLPRLSRLAASSLQGIARHAFGWAGAGATLQPARVHASFLVAVTNPKGYLFFSAFLPQFIVPNQPQLPQYAILAVTFMAIDFAVMFVYAVAGAQAIRFLRAKGVLWLDRICGGALLALAGSLTLYRRQA